MKTHAGFGGGHLIKTAMADRKLYGQMVESAHRMSYMRQNNLFKHNISRMDECGHLLDISHICHNKSCINSKHLVLEQHAINQDREHCKAQGRCSGCHRPVCVI
jgi:hypothetical protein